jgi:hypothetical protein
MNNAPKFPDFPRPLKAVDMTLRDYFAAKAMLMDWQGINRADDIAATSYIMADAMLAERTKDQSK